MRDLSSARFAARSVLRSLWLASLSLIAVARAVEAQEPAPLPVAQPAERGTISGTVTDRETARPLSFANVIVVGTRLGAQTDLDGRFRIVVPAPAMYDVRAMRIGYAMAQIDSVRVRSGDNTSVNFSLGPAAVQLQAVEVEGGPVRATSEGALLALQKAAPRVSDGISAEAISRAPGSDAADAIVRVTGVSVLDDKFVVVRGLAERYSNTLLNGVELTSPEPLKKIVPLDLFPASLLESIITSKTATPDRPGDFAGGSVEITTKEFPEKPVAEVSVSMGYNSEGTFRKVRQLPQRGLDFLGFDDGDRRRMPANPPTDASASYERELFAESLRNLWTPTPSRIAPDFGFGLNLGGRVGSETSPLGYVLALTYSHETDYTPDRLSQLSLGSPIAETGYLAEETTHSTDVGAIANFAVRLGQYTKIGLKNLYTRSAEEVLSENNGFEIYIGSERRIHQARYVVRELIQTQITGDHLIGLLGNSRIEWKGSVSSAARDEPENRSLIYFKNHPETGGYTVTTGTPSPYWFRFLDDRLYSAQLDWSIPLGLRRSDDALIKIGGAYRTRDRSFDARSYFIRARQDLTPLPEATGLPPEQALAPENVGPILEFLPLAQNALPYESDDDITAAFAMVDLPVLSSIRVVGGVRMEDWKLVLRPATREPTRRKNRDYLWSANVTWSLNDRQNLRFAAYRTLARPDPREVSDDYYTQITGDCGNRGNANIQRTTILNGDVRWEMYPRPGELLSASVFYKNFDDPIVERLLTPGLGSCEILFDNVDAARNYGGEIEIRRTLDFLPGFWNRLSAGLNVTVVQSEADYRPTPDTLLQLPLQGQSDYLANANLLYTDPDRGFQLSLLVNTFGDRTVRYGSVHVAGGQATKIPDVVERGRTTVDAKIQKQFWGGVNLSLSGRNLTDAEVLFVQETGDGGVVRTGYFRPGITIGLGLGYALR
jgi:TonB dependent receptor/CarboxypepD_reg-like domain/TonB-dependent Receptor Plug Domain